MKNKKYRELKKTLEWWVVKEVILKKINLTEEGKKIAIYEIIKHNKVINKGLKSKI